MELSKIKEEINRRQQEKNNVSMKLGENVNSSTIIPKDTFLNDLLISLKTGQSSVSTNIIKNVENRAAKMLKEEEKFTVTQNSPSKPAKTMNDENFDNNEREELLFRNFEKNKKNTLSESLLNYNNQNNTQQQSQQQFQQPLNETLINNVHKIVNNYITEGFGVIVEETIKSTIIELFAAEKIKEVLYENKEMIQKIVIETIKGIQAKKKT